MRRRFAAAAARYRRRAGRAAPPPRAPGAPPGRPTTCAGRGATADPSIGAVPVRTPGRWSPSTCSGRAPRRAACRAEAPPRERLRPAGRRPGGCSCRRPARSARAGAAGAAAGRPTPGRPTAPQTDHAGTIPARAKREAATPMEPRPARARPRAPTPGDASAAEVVEQGLRPMTARRVRQRERKRERRRVPDTASRARSTPAAAAARRHARRRGPAHQRGSPPAPRACLPSPHRRRAVRQAVQAPASNGPLAPLAPLAHPFRPALPAAQAAWFGQRNRGPDRGSDPDRRSGARYGTGARPARRRQRWFPTAPPQSDSACRSAGWPAPTMAPAQPHRLDAPLRGGVGEAGGVRGVTRGTDHARYAVVTVSVDGETHRLARIRAAELETSVSALVRDYLRGLSLRRHAEPGVGSRPMETPRERRRRLMNEVFEDIRSTRSGFSSSDNVPREDLYELQTVVLGRSDPRRGACCRMRRGLFGRPELGAGLRRHSSD